MKVCSYCYEPGHYKPRCPRLVKPSPPKRAYTKSKNWTAARERGWHYRLLRIEGDLNLRVIECPLCWNCLRAIQKHCPLCRGTRETTDTQARLAYEERETWKARRHRFLRGEI